MFKLTKKKVAAGIVAAGIIAGTGMAYAFWTAPGAGNGTATTKTSNGSLTLNVTADSTNLYPGGSAPVTVTATNTSTGTSLKVTTVSFSSLSVDDDHATAGCLAADYHVGTVTPTPTVVAAGTTSGTVGSATLSMDNTANDQDACKGAVITLNFTSA
jgi:hypothetical protein